MEVNLLEFIELAKSVKLSSDVLMGTNQDASSTKQVEILKPDIKILNSSNELKLVSVLKVNYITNCIVLYCISEI